jgi:hypothetical protein
LLGDQRRKPEDVRAEDRGCRQQHPHPRDGQELRRLDLGNLSAQPRDHQGRRSERRGDLIADVALPNRLLVDRVSFSPYILRSRRTVVGRFRVTDSQNHPVRGALVFAVAIPFGNMTTPPEQATGPDGYVRFVFRPTARLKVGGRGSQPFMIRARKSGERLIGGVSTRRLVNLSIRGR